MKQLTEVAKKQGEILWPSFWKDLVGFELYFGAPPINGEKFPAQIEEWVNTVKPEDAEGSDRRRVTEIGMQKIKQTEILFPDQMSVAEFFDNPSRWLANGASTGTRLPGSKGTKFSTYLNSTKADLMQALMSKATPGNVVNPKRERGKNRNTVSSDWDLYVQMKWLAQGAENAMESIFPTTLSNKINAIDRWSAWRRRVRSSIAVPIDQSKFDHVPWMDLLEVAIRYLCDSARKKSPEPDLHRRITDLVVQRIRAGSVSWEGKTWKHVRGLLSGWAWTATLGTLINYVEFLVSRMLPRAQCPTSTVCASKVTTPWCSLFPGLRLSRLWRTTCAYSQSTRRNFSFLTSAPSSCAWWSRRTTSAGTWVEPYPP